MTFRKIKLINNEILRKIKRKNKYHLKNIRRLQNMTKYDENDKLSLYTVAQMYLSRTTV